VGEERIDTQCHLYFSHHRALACTEVTRDYLDLADVEGISLMGLPCRFGV